MKVDIHLRRARRGIKRDSYPVPDDFSPPSLPKGRALRVARSLIWEGYPPALVFETLQQTVESGDPSEVLAFVRQSMMALLDEGGIVDPNALSRDAALEALRAAAGGPESGEESLDAIGLLERQHRDVESLFEAFAGAAADDKEEIFQAIADALSVHAAIEERYFYPAAKRQGTEELLRESVEEHLSIKREMADALATAADDENFEAKVAVLHKQVTQHVKQEETELFPQVQEFLDPEQLKSLAKKMRKLVQQLEQEGAPRDNVFSEISFAAPLEHKWPIQ